MQNPFFQPYQTPFNTPPFDQIELEHYMPAIEEGIRQAKEEIERIKTNPDPPTFENTIVALERGARLLDEATSIFFNLNEAHTNEQMQQLAPEISTRLTAYRNDMMLDATLFARIRTVMESAHPDSMSAEQYTLLEKTYKSFHRNGALLDEPQKSRLREIDTALAKISLSFGENLLKETNRFELHLTYPEQVRGLPESTLEAAATTAKERGKEEGWLFTLHMPSYLPFMMYAEDRELRRELFMAYASRACKGDELDNRPNILQIVQLRHERAQLLGYPSHADFTLEERMAGTAGKVRAFLDELLDYALPAAQKDLEEVLQLARQTDGLTTLERWDFSFYSEKLRKKKYDIDDELLRPYFQLENVVDGVFETATLLYGIRFVENPLIPVYHPEVKAYEVQDADGSLLAIFYADFFPRESKRNGAWMTAFRGQWATEEGRMHPLISIVCNFTKPTSTRPSLLTLDEVLTLFHEFGHALHGILANSTYESLSGTNVFWDFVELPSQIMENWVYEKECLDLFARHYQTGEAIPEEYIRRIRESANFLSGYQTVRQIGFGLSDMAWHGPEGAKAEDVVTFEEQATSRTQLFPPVPGTCFSSSFSHIFHGGYASGYYSYKWAEVLDADAFQLFKEKGIFNKQVANAFRKHILSAGGTEHPMALYKRFRGHEPSVQALLERSGLLSR